MSVELSMIVKNEAATLARCLASVRKVVDRIVIGDTGSTDGTAAIAASYGAEIVPVSWTGDFASARNAVLRYARCDWILVLDADEMLDADGAEELSRLTRLPWPAAYDVPRWNYVLETTNRNAEQGALRNPGTLLDAIRFPAYVSSINTRVFRRNPEVYFERPVHETVVYRLQHLQLPIGMASFVIHHLGTAEDSKATRAKKNELYQEIGLRHLELNPKDARSCFELGLGQLEHFKRPEAALALFLRALELNEKESSALIFAGVCLVRMQRYSEALELLGYASKVAPGTIVLHETMGDAHFHLGRYPQANAAYKMAMEMGSVSALVLAKSGSCEIHIGGRESGVECLHEALRREPNCPELLDLVALGYALARENGLAAATARRRLAMAGVSPFHYSLACTLFRLAGDMTTYRELARQGSMKFPDNQALPT